MTCSLSGPVAVRGCGQGVPWAGGWGQDEYTACADAQQSRRRAMQTPRGPGPRQAGNPPFLSPHRMDPAVYAELLRESGNQDFKNGNFSLALRKYEEAIQILLQLYHWG